MHYYNLLVFESSKLATEFFTYKSTEILEVGRIVVVPWGKKESIAAVAEIIDTQKDSSITIKDIKLITDNIINKKYLEFILWISEHYLAPVISIADVAGLNRNFKLKHNNNKNIVLEDISTLNYDYIEKALLNIQLNEAQDVVYKKIKNSTKRYLLEGVTGSGKTYVYLKVALDTVVHGKQVLILLPEILLSKQIYKLIVSLVGNDNVFLYNSKISKAQRTKITAACQNGKPCIVVGTRSALFLQFSNLGCIVIDEEHDLSYKQENNLRFHSRDLVAKLASIHNCLALFVSATPSLFLKYLVAVKRIEHLSIASRYNNLAMPNTTVVKIDRNEILSPLLIDEIKNSLSLKKQILLLYNRRGTAQLILCSECQNIAVCEECNTNLTLHTSSNSKPVFKCHFCGNTENSNINCKTCGNGEWLFIGLGTKRIEEKVKQLFKFARVARLDNDTENPDEVISQTEVGKLDIIIGTQMLAKGFNFDKVNLVAVLAIENFLSIPDYNTTELAFQQVIQMAGRAGRSFESTNSKLIIQTYNLDNIIFKYLKDSTYFENNELGIRNKLRLPPYVFLAKIVLRGKNKDYLFKKALRLAKELALSKKVAVSLPIELNKKTQQSFQVQIVVRSLDRNEILKAVSSLKSTSNIYWDIDCVSTGG